MTILGIETSCDETAAAVVRDGRHIISSVVNSQAKLHARYGGVVPEVASRAHVESIHQVCGKALDEAGFASAAEVDAVAVTYAPGLIGSLLAGVSFAKALAYRYGKPLVPVHHIRGHIAAAYLGNPGLETPFLAFVASGGHTSIIRVDGYTAFTPLGATCDDAAGEAFDKIARAMGLGYPGGAAIERIAAGGDPGTLKIPVASTANGLDFSFSGIKTFVVNHLHRMEQKGEPLTDAERANVAASLTAGISRAICGRLRLALASSGLKTLVCAGGVMANQTLRADIGTVAAEYGAALHIPPAGLCGDNGAMIAAQGYYEFMAGNAADMSLNAAAVMAVDGMF